MPPQMVSPTERPAHGWQTRIAPVPGENVCISNWPRKRRRKKEGDYTMAVEISNTQERPRGNSDIP